MPGGQAACPASPHLAVPTEARPSRYSTSCPALQVSPKASSSLEGKQKPQGSSGCSLLHHRTHSPMPSSLSRRPAWAMGSRDEEPTSLLLHRGGGRRGGEGEKGGQMMGKQPPKPSHLQHLRALQRSKCQQQLHGQVSAQHPFRIPCCFQHCDC